MSKFSNAFVTGCDHKTEWMLEWFMKNFRKHSRMPIIFVDLGVSNEKKAWIKQNFEQYVDLSDKRNEYDLGWFLKPRAMIETDHLAQTRVWIDTDVEVKGDPSSLFKLIPKESIAIAVDRPWSRRRNERWHNTGVFGVTGVPRILIDWEINCRNKMKVPVNPNMPPIGDQDILHEMLQNDILRSISISELPNKFNVLRLQLIDQDIPDTVVMLHWTGAKGKEQIRNMI